MKIRNINDKFGDAIEFEAQTELQCRIDMAQCVSACGPECAITDDDLALGVDYEVIED